MTDTEIIAELGRTYKNRSAIDDLQLLTGMYLCELIPIVCDTIEFKRHEAYHSRTRPVRPPQYNAERMAQLRDEAVSLYNSGLCHREVADRLGVCKTIVQATLAEARESGVEVREYYAGRKETIN